MFDDGPEAVNQHTKTHAIYGAACTFRNLSVRPASSRVLTRRVLNRRMNCSVNRWELLAVLGRLLLTGRCCFSMIDAVAHAFTVM